MICGIGIDITEIQRIKNILLRHDQRFVKKILTLKERNFLQSHGPITAHTLAARFAAKEAAVKALGTGFNFGITFQHIHIINAASGQPLIDFEGPAADKMAELGANKSHISISHGRDTACAVVILEDICKNS